MQIFMSDPSIISSAGLSTKATLKSVLDKKSHIYDKDGFMLGFIKEHLAPFKKNTKSEFITRTNQILLSAILPLENEIKKAITKFSKFRVGIVLGNTTSGTEENLLSFINFAKTKIWDNKFDINKNSLYNPSKFLQDYLGLDGICFSISTACTSGIKAIIDGFRLIKNDICDAIICGGVDSISSLTLEGFSSLSVLSKERLNPFSKNRDGTNLGEGAGIVLLSKERISNIEILGYGCNADAYHMTKPNEEAIYQIEVIKKALKMANLHNADYINLHGTATMANDQMEALAINTTLKNTPSSSSKPIFGHTLGAAGAIETALCYESIKNKILLPHLFDGKYDQNIMPINLCLEAKKDDVKTAINLSFAFGGDNAAIILGQAND